MATNEKKASRIPQGNWAEFQTLIQVMHTLRAPGGCPWDAEQTHTTLTRYAIEEAHELADAVESGKKDDLVEELGDLLLQVVFHSEIGAETERFDIQDVIKTLNEKLIRRHPHVFGDVEVSGSGEVLKNWDEIKKTEKQGKPASDERIGKPVGQPGLMRAHKIGEHTKKEKFDWPDTKGVMQQLRSEMTELENAFANPSDREALLSEIGDMLFTLSQLARHLKSDAEQLIKDTNNRFEQRYFKMKLLAEEAGQNWHSLLPEEKETYWQKAKASLR